MEKQERVREQRVQVLHGCERRQWWDRGPHLRRRLSSSLLMPLVGSSSEEQLLEPVRPSDSSSLDPGALT
jgi:hypothetical protein